MNIGQMFAKSINREIKPVVKPGTSFIVLCRNDFL